MTTKNPTKEKPASETSSESAPTPGAQAAPAPNSPSAPAAALGQGEPQELKPESEPELNRYTVTGRSDVLHDGDLYREGDDIYLSDAAARPLLNRGHVVAEGRQP